MDWIAKRWAAQQLRDAPERRTLDDTDLDSFWSAADERSHTISRDEIIAHLKRKNSHRWWRLNYDYKWAKKQMRKLGLPEDTVKDLLL